MPSIYGIMGLQDTDRSYLNTLGQSVVYDAVAAYLAQHSADVSAALSVFVAETTTDFARRFKSPGGGYMQRRSTLGAPGAVKGTGEWDVAFPIEDWGDALAQDDVTLAYMTTQDLDRHLATVTARNLNTIRRAVLQALFNAATRSVQDDIRGALTIQPLANGDSVVYPPVVGDDAGATENHYIETNYATASISDINQPLVSLRNELEEHFGAMQGGENLAAFFNQASISKISALTGFVKLNDMGIRPGDDTATVMGLPSNLPGRLVGRCEGVWVVEWRWIPADYMLGINLDVEAPLIRRVDESGTGLGEGLQLVARQENFPLEAAFYRNRFGFGVGNRLNGVCYEFATGGSYTTPTALAY